jgi:hypothetical protein
VPRIAIPDSLTPSTLVGGNMPTMYVTAHPLNEDRAREVIRLRQRLDTRTEYRIDIRPDCPLQWVYVTAEPLA